MNEPIQPMVNVIKEPGSFPPKQCLRPPAAFLPFEKTEITHSIPERFERIVSRYPDRLAIKNGGETLTYRELDNRSTQIAHAILSQRLPGSEPVVLLLENSTMLLVSMLGVLKAGKFYVVMDAFSPRVKLISILEHTQAALILTDQQYASLAAELAQNRHVLHIDEIPFYASYARLDLPIASDALAALFYTSGSTGQPKAVERTHRTILYSVWQDTTNYHISCEDRHTLLFSCAFASSMRSVFNSWLNGAVVCPFNTLKAVSRNMITWLNDEAITMLHPPISFFRQWLDMLSEDDFFPKLRLIFLADVYAHDVERVRQHIPEECCVIHQLVSTEAGVIAHFPINHQTDVGNRSIPVGYVIGEREVFLLDDAGRQVGADQVGEIVVRSRYLAPGYWNDPELTRQKFRPDPEGGDQHLYLTGDLGRMCADGCLEYLGRKDDQIKIRGYTVELREVEAALHALSSIKEAVVIAPHDQRGERHLVAYLVPASQPAPTVGELRRALAGQLSEYMIPARFIMLDALPLTPTGKVDRQALPAPEQSRPELTTEFVAPHNEIESQLVQMFETILHVQPIGVQDNFFELGGDSILALRLIARIEHATGNALPLPTLLQAPTIAQLAEVLRQEGWTPPWSALVALQPGGAKPPFFCVPPGAVTALRFVKFARYLGPDQPFYGLQPLGMDHDDVAPHTRMEEMAAHYLQEIRQLQPEGPYYLGGQCLGGIVAFEMAQQLVAQGQQVALLAILDTRLPPGVVKTGTSPDALVRHYWHRGWQAWHEGEFWQLGGRKLTHWLRKYRKRKQLAKIWQRVMSSVKGAMERLHPRDEAEIIQKQRIKRVQKAHTTARWTYEPRVYPGKITFFWSRDTRRGLREEWARWSTEALEIHICPGRHNTMLQEPHIQVVAEKLQACIEQAHAAASKQAQTADSLLRQDSSPT